MDYARSIGLGTTGPIKGPEGNIEYLLYLQNKPQEETGQEENELSARAIVEQAHGVFGLTWSSGLHKWINNV